MQQTGFRLSAAVLGGAFLVAMILAPASSLAQTTVVLAPTGGDDTAALGAAFDAAIAAGPGSTIELLAGTYRISEPLLIRGFSGTWRGAGIGETLIEIEGAGGAPFPLTSFGPVDPAFPADPPFDGFSGVFVFVEVQGGAPTDLTLSDFSFQIRGEAERWGPNIFGVPVWNTIGELIRVLPKRGFLGPPDRTTANVEVDRVEVVGELITNLPLFGVIDNLFNFVSASGTTAGNELQMALRISRSHFEFCDRMVIVQTLVDSKITIGGLPPDANHFEAGTNAFWFSNLQNSTVSISQNLINTQLLALIFQDLPPGAGSSSYHIHHNAVDTAFFTDYFAPAAIFILDFGVFSGDGSADVVIEHNDFDFAEETPFGLEDGPGFFYGPLEALIGGAASAGILVRENRISGPFNEGAITLGVGFGLPNRNALLIGNNVQHVDAGVAPIWLRPESSDSTVVGNPNQVLDEGTNNDVSGQ